MFTEYTKIVDRSRKINKPHETMKVQSARPSETSVSYRNTTRRHNPKDADLNLPQASVSGALGVICVAQWIVGTRVVTYRSGAMGCLHRRDVTTWQNELRTNKMAVMALVSAYD
jgi:hypothetical protein